MKNWLKTFWKDLGDLSNPDFFHKYVLPALALFFTWGFVGHLMLLSLDKNSLVKNTGQVIHIAIKFEQGTKQRYKYYPLKIGLTNHNEEYRLSDVFKNDFSELEQKILLGDTITIYTRHNWQTILGWGKLIDIYQIEKDGQTLFDISNVIAEKKSQTTIFTIFCIILWPWYFIYRQKRKTG